MPAWTSDEKGVCLSVCLSNAWTVTKRKKDLSRFLHCMKNHLARFSEKKNGWWGRSRLPKILGHSPSPALYLVCQCYAYSQYKVRNHPCIKMGDFGSHKLQSNKVDDSIN